MSKEIRSYVGMLLGCFLMFGVITYFFVRSESEVLKNHQSVIDLFSSIKETEILIEKDVLRSHDFTFNNYDRLTTSEEELAQSCIVLKQASTNIYLVLGTDMDQTVRDYCDSVEAKITVIEIFKSKNAILRNSVFYINKVAADYFITSTSANKESSEHHLQSHLIQSATAYYVTPGANAREQLMYTLDKTLSYLKKSRKTAQLDGLILHVEKILQNKDKVDELIATIVNAEKSNRLLTSMINTYFRYYTKARANSVLFRDLLYASCVGLFCFILFGIIRIWHVAAKLAHLNLTLEGRVEKRTEDLMQAQKKVMEQQQTLMATTKLSALGEMAGGVAHEINTPLAIIGLKIEQLEDAVRDQEFDKADFLKHLEIIQKTSERIAKIVRGLRFFSRDGRNQPMAPVSVESIIDDTLSFCREKFASHGVTLNIVKPENFSQLQFECRSIEISQVLLNLLNNASDAIQNLTDKWVNVTIEDQIGSIKLSVTDSGSGIPRDIQEKIMQPFFTTKEVGKGTGLGLSISRGIIENHRGTLRIDSTSSNTKFDIVIPKVFNADQNKNVSSERSSA